MKVTLLLTILGVAATNTASTSAYELPQFLRGIAVQAKQCRCRNNGDCNNDEYCNTDKNCKIDGDLIGTCQLDTNRGGNDRCNRNSDCPGNDRCDVDGYCVSTGRVVGGTCDRDNDCDRDEYCTSSGFCRVDPGGSGWACNYKQCTNKGNQDLCECSWDEYCAKGGESGANTCSTTADLNGCCVPALEKEAGIYIQGQENEGEEGTELGEDE